METQALSFDGNNAGRLLRVRRSAWHLAAALMGLVWGGAPLRASTPASTAPARPFLLSVEAVADALPYAIDTDTPVTLLLSRSRYPAEDGHLDALLWLGGNEPLGENEEVWIELRVESEEASSSRVRRDRVATIPGRTLFISYAFPEEMAGRKGELRVVRLRGGTVSGESRQSFEVSASAPVETAGRIKLTVPNTAGAVLRGAPMSVGVPFPRGALTDERQVRLVDEHGADLPLQTRITGRWSRFGSIKWLLCDFTVDVDGEGRELFLEYGPKTKRPESSAFLAEPGEERRGFPHVEAGPLRIDADGVHFDVSGTGDYAPVLAAEALHGAFVEHENGTVHEMPSDTMFRIEESGPEKVVVLREGWYRDPASGAPFCRFVTRFVVHRGSPLLRIFHTWIYTGDAWGDERIANMGWRFPAAKPLEPAGFLSAYGESGRWIQGGDYLIQHDYDQYRIHRGKYYLPGERAPGVFAATVGDARVTIGIKHFWQNFPHELEFDGDAMVYHMWPKHGEPAQRDLTPENASRLWFAHEGERLDFSVPIEYFLENKLGTARFSGMDLRAGEHLRTVNAQGTAKTTELWVFVEPETAPQKTAADLMAGLDDDTLRAIVDPVWQCASGVFYEIHPEDRENYPEWEEVYEQQALAPYRWAERVPVYGKWIWGDMVWAPNLREGGTRGIYRMFRKAHQGWPYSWVPYARSGDPRYFTLADAATRYMTDVPYIHYADERAVMYDLSTEAYVPRPRGRHIRFQIPWGNHRWWVGGEQRGYTDKCDYLWHAYYMTGYARARDVILDWADLAKHSDQRNGYFSFPEFMSFSHGPRGSMTLLKSYTEMYEATFDPWFLAAAHQIARTHMEAFHTFPDPDFVPPTDWFARRISITRKYTGHFWQPGPREFHRFAGCDRYKEFFLRYARDGHGSPRFVTGWASNSPMAEAPSHAYLLTGDMYFARRAAHWIDWTRVMTYDGDPDYRVGWPIRGGPIYVPFYLSLFPHALHAVDKAGGAIPPAPQAFFQAPAESVPRDAESGLYEWRMTTIAIRKDAHAVPLLLQVNQEGRPDEGKAFFYAIEDARGARVQEGAWEDITDTLEAEIPANAPAGIYRVKVWGTSSHSNITTRYGNRRMPALMIPLSPPGTPEVMELEPGEAIGKGHYHAQYWFRLPEDLETLELHVDLEPQSDGFDQLVRVGVWNDAYAPVWMEQFDQADQPGRKRVEARITVPEGQAGRLWRVTAPFFHMGIHLDQRVARVFAVSPDRWFDPRNHGQGDTTMPENRENDLTYTTHFQDLDDWAWDAPPGTVAEVGEDGVRETSGFFSGIATKTRRWM